MEHMDSTDKATRVSADRPGRTQPPKAPQRSALKQRGGQRGADYRDLAGRKKIRRRTTASPGAYVKAGAAIN